MLVRIKIIAFASALALVGVSCASQPSEALAFEDSAPTENTTAAEDTATDPGQADVGAAEPEAEAFSIDAPGDLMAFQATWLCEVQRRTFPNLDDIDIALEDALVANGLDRAGYDNFLAELDGSQELRDELLRTFGQRCRA